MFGLQVEELLIIACCVIILSYLYSILGKYLRLPSVLLLLFTGIALRAIADANHFQLNLPSYIVEGLGIVGLIMIMLEAGLDLKISRNKFKLIRYSFFSALGIFVLSATLVTAILFYWLKEPVVNCIVYAIPLSIMSSTIVIPSISPLSPQKQEFLVYEASFSDIIGIVAFNYFFSDQLLSSGSFVQFGGGIIIAVILSFLFSLLLFLILTRTRLKIKFFLLFALLILIYASGKLLKLPSLLIILVFGIMINNWEKMKIPALTKLFPLPEIESIRELLHSLTAESSFLVRTFFFVLFGFSISLGFISNTEVWEVGGLIVLALFMTRLLFLKFFVRTNVIPEVFFIPRGLITIVLFYKIPDKYKLANFNESILFFIILTTGLVMMLGMLFYKKPAKEIVEDSLLPPPPIV
jgi:Kef-type K+ transport system membrane component KefB